MQTDDEEALKDEGEEALRLQRQAAEVMRPEDFEQVSEPGSSDEEQEAERIDTLGNRAAAGVSSNAAETASSISVLEASRLHRGSASSHGRSKCGYPH